MGYEFHPTLIYGQKPRSDVGREYIFGKVPISSYSLKHRRDSNLLFNFKK